MPARPELSSDLIQAIQLLETIKGKIQTPQHRKSISIELAALMLNESNRTQTRQEKKRQKELARMMKDPRGKAFTTAMTDQCFRSHRSSRIASQLVYLLRLFGIPQYLSPFKQLQLAFFQLAGQFFSSLFVPAARWTLRKETATVILPGEKKALSHHMQKRRAEGVRLNLNHLGEAILGEREAVERLNTYLNDLAEENIEYVSIKISTIFSQINLIAWDKTIELLAERLRALYRVAKLHSFIHADGRKTPKFVNLDMEEYRDLRLTVELFKKVLNEPEFHDFSAGIVLQAYLPDAHEIQKELTEWAIQRIKNKGAPIKIRIVKGANLAMEQFEASLRHWPQAPYTHKVEVDANYKRMITYGFIPEHAKAAHIGVASHNLFDIAYALVLRAEREVEKEVSFEMLEGMADPIRRVVQKLSKDILLYCPVARKEDFQSAVAYLIRRLDENTGPDNFLRHTFELHTTSVEWEKQAELFSSACDEMNKVFSGPRKVQNRNLPPEHLSPEAPFENEADTDFSLAHNQTWVLKVMHAWENKKIDPIPSVIGGKEFYNKEEEISGIDPSHPQATRYTYSLASWDKVDEALKIAKQQEPLWEQTPSEKRCTLILQAAKLLREKRGDLIGCMMVDAGKIGVESDTEISEAIDFAEYYVRARQKMEACTDISWKAKGTILITPPWNFPISIPAGGIFAALVAGNCVLFKPAPEAVLSGWILVNILWDAGIPKEVLQFIVCKDDPVGSKLIKDPRVNGVILTGATSTAALFLQMNPALNLSAETGGKNALIISALSDRDLAIKDLIHSAFGHSGQKCSAASLAILEAEVYDDPLFLKQLKDAVESLKVDSAWNPAAKVVPLIHAPQGNLLRALTTLEEGESWLVQPKQNPQNPHLWSPGVKMGVKEGSFMHQTEFFGPILSVMRATNLEHAVHLSNHTPYGLTAGLHSLDEREQLYWTQKIVAGNLYINRTITGAIVRRQPFGGCKASGFGSGAKAGGPNYVAHFSHPTQISLPREKAPPSPLIEQLSPLLEKLKLSAEDLGIWYASISNYSFWSKKFTHFQDPSKIVGQDNFFSYMPYSGIVLRLYPENSALDILRVCAASLSCETPLQISWDQSTAQTAFVNDQWKHLMPTCKIVYETEARFLERVKLGTFKRIRLISNHSDLATGVSKELLQAAAHSMTHIAKGPVLASGRFELLHYLRESSLSIDYHRYGNLGVREGEMRKAIL